MGLFKDVVKAGTNITRQVHTAVVQTAGGIPVVGGALTTASSMGLMQVNAIDKALGINKKVNAKGEIVSDAQFKIDAQKAIDEENLLIANKKKKIIIYSFVGFSVISIALISYFLINKKSK
jgi:glycerol-3-phosphate dehydrogenase